MNPAAVIQKYFASVRGRDIESFIALFAQGAIFVLPDGRQLSGVRAIREMELGVFAATAPLPTPGHMVVGENSVAVEIEVRLPSGALYRAASFFQLDEQGLISRLCVYRQGE